MMDLNLGGGGRGGGGEGGVGGSGVMADMNYINCAI